MKRLVLYLAVALVSFATGVTASYSWQYLTERSVSCDRPIPNVETTNILAVTETNQRKYHRGVAGRAIRGSFITLNSTDGLGFTKWTVYFDSPQLANEALQKRLRKAVRIISREVTFGQDGTEIGEKVVAVFRGNTASLLWTEQDEMCEVEGSSLHDILEYRKDFRR